MRAVHLPIALVVMSMAMLLGGFVAPLFAFLLGAFTIGAIEAKIQDRRRMVPAMAMSRRRAF